ncbi:MAG: hypothetical protein HXY34_00395, partial [Candidatus Thorarchaeota archaeon]|nr:hypothetical protein [Candidatus Thorarchaeota archaeon]
YNFPMFKNASYDSWRDQLLHSTDYDEVYEAAIEMQKIWVYQVPSLICYENQVLYAYRTDKYAGHVNDALYGTPNFWTNYRVHLKQSEGGPTGGDFRYGMDWCPDLNFMRSPVTIADRMLDNLYDSLLRRGPDGKDLPWLATSYTAQTHAQNSSIPSGHTRFVFQVVRNATWSNGWPLTADDIAFSLNFYKNGFGIWLGVDLVDMVSATAPTPYELVVEFSTESYWHLHTIAYKYVISELAFASITPSNWSSWNPDPETMVTSGPFLFSDRAIDEFCRLAKNPRYFLRPNEPPTVSSPPDMTYVVNTTGHSITWNATDTDPLLWMVFKNDTLYAMNIFWDGGPITIKIDNLTLGCYNFTLYVADASMNIVTDSVFVYVVEADYLLPVLVTAGVASAVVVVAVVVLGARRRTPLG